jgi:hypothetical protein
MADGTIYTRSRTATQSAPKAQSRTSGKKTSGGDGPSGAEQRANARADAERAKAGKRYLQQASNLEIQARALTNALKYSFGRQRNQNLTDISMRLTEQINLLKSTSTARGQQFIGTAKDTEKAASDTETMSRSTMLRERQNAMDGILQQGAGETDAMRAMLMSARNWQANVTEGSRSYFDTMRSINSSITDLNADTQTALANAHRDAENQREATWQDYYNKRTEASTQLGNVRGQQADYYAMAKEMGVKPPKRAESRAIGGMKQGYNGATSEAGKSYVQQALPAWMKTYKAASEQTARRSNTDLAAAVTIDKAEKAEGASLRRWEG